MEAVVPAAAGRRGAGRRGTGAGHGAAVAVCGAARRAGRGRRGAGPALARRGLGDAAPALLVTPTRPGRRPAPHARGRAGAVPRDRTGARPGGRAGAGRGLPEQRMQCQHPAASAALGRHAQRAVARAAAAGAAVGDACRAILAHECAHIAGRHGRYASRVYFARLQWQEAARQLARRKGLANAPLRLFMNWHVPRFLAASLDFARECEYRADAESARVCGVACASDALMATCLQGRALHEYASSLYADAAATEPPWLLVRLAEDGLLASPRDQAEAQIWLHQALCRPTSHDDTHPSLADRLAALKVPRALDERATPAPDAPGMPGAQGMASTHSLPATSAPALASRPALRGAGMVAGPAPAAGTRAR
ncbi:M48 family metalloprotease [Achromobacter xylosoxidans]